ncbi:MAG TPA: hypothetical protein DCG06_12500 [Deltaproteobacteria bacterium]|nr:hypothetical protein [Deltaproteobacteria bacterium]
MLRSKVQLFAQSTIEVIEFSCLLSVILDGVPVQVRVRFQIFLLAPTHASALEVEMVSFPLLLPQQQFGLIDAGDPVTIQIHRTSQTSA